jgi:hypothetical protein
MDTTTEVTQISQVKIHSTKIRERISETITPTIGMVVEKE